MIATAARIIDPTPKVMMIRPLTVPGIQPTRRNPALARLAKLISLAPSEHERASPPRAPATVVVSTLSYANITPSQPGTCGAARRCVHDGNVIMAAGIDMAFCLLGVLKSPQIARTLQRGIEYEPAPPYADVEPLRVDG